MSLDTPLDPFTPPSRRSPGLLESDDRAPDHGDWCNTCYRDTKDCPGHDEDPKALDIMAALVNALKALPGLHPVPKSIIHEINRCEDYLRRHNPDYLNERF